MKILHIDSSITGEASVTRRLSRAVVNRLLDDHPDAKVVRRDLANAPLPWFDATALTGVKPIAATSQFPESDVDAETLLSEFLTADVIVVGAPMYNFSVPAQLKTWIDYLARPGATFRYTSQGPVGLAGGRRVVIASSRGNFYGPGSDNAHLDHQESYLLAVFALFGLTDVDIVRVEGARLSPEAVEHAMRKAKAAIESLVFTPPAVHETFGLRRIQAGLRQ